MRVINAIRPAIRFSTSQRETPKELPHLPPPPSLFLSRQARNFHEFSRNLMSARLILSYTKEIYGSNKSNLYVPPPPCKIHQLCNLTLSLPLSPPPPLRWKLYATWRVVFFFFLIKKCQESLHPATNKQHAKNILYLFFLVVGIYIFFTWNREGGREKIFTPLGWGGVIGPTGFVQRGVKSTFINFYRWNRVILFLLVLSLFFFFIFLQVSKYATGGN